MIDSGEERAACSSCWDCVLSLVQEIRNWFHYGSARLESLAKGFNLWHCGVQRSPGRYEAFIADIAAGNEFGLQFHFHQPASRMSKWKHLSTSPGCIGSLVIAGKTMQDERQAWPEERRCVISARDTFCSRYGQDKERRAVDLGTYAGPAAGCSCALISLRCVTFYIILYHFISFYVYRCILMYTPKLQTWCYIAFNVE